MRTKNLQENSLQSIEIEKIKDNEKFSFEDVLAVEEPLEIRIRFGNEKHRQTKNISVTMRTPGNDEDLAIGFLFTEGILQKSSQILQTEHAKMLCATSSENTITVETAHDFVPNLQQADRNFYTTSSCGVCGKGSIESIKTVSPFQDLRREKWEIETQTIFQLPNKLRISQENFSSTGGIHASGLFTKKGDLITLREDVGRHNALDKLIGFAFQNDLLPLSEHVLLLSGRASFELIQKAAMAGIQVVAAIGAPSSLAVQLAREFDITLIGFLKENRMNVYHQSKNISLNLESIKKAK